MEESERDEGFKVTDKRRFTTEGQTKEGEAGPSEEREDRTSQTAKSGASPNDEETQAPGTEQEKKAGEEQSLPPLDFSGFVLSLANTTLFQLGLIKVPNTEEVKKDLQGARQTIDLLGILEKKTRGNLTEEEKRLLTDTLFQLRMAFVEASK